MTPRRFFREALFAVGGSVVAIFLLYYLHREWMPEWALGCGVVAGVFLRRALEPTYSTFPNFLRRPLNLATVLLGTIVAVSSTLAAGRFATANYWYVRRFEAAWLVAAAVLVGLGIAANVYTHSRMRREVEEHRIREAVLRETALKAQLKALQAQINPHFLFNAFNALAELAHEDPDRAEELIGDLAHLLRYSLRSSAVDTVPLAQELEAVERYLRVERARLGRRLQVEQKVDPGATQVLIPGLILQPLVENAVQHAIASRPEGGLVSIRVKNENEMVRITVEDDGHGLPDEVRDRLGGFVAVAALAGIERAVESGTAPVVGWATSRSAWRSSTGAPRV